MVAAKEQEELARRERLYRGDRPLPDGPGRTVILVDSQTTDEEVKDLLARSMPVVQRAREEAGRAKHD